jgi:hypothetical protein
MKKTLIRQDSLDSLIAMVSQEADKDDIEARLTEKKGRGTDIHYMPNKRKTGSLGPSSNITYH